MAKQYQTFKEFYPYYLSQHQHPICQLLHVIGSIIALFFVLCALIFWQWYWLLLAVLMGYGFAWVGHFYFEKNKPATLQYPWYSFIADYKMLAQSIKKIFKRSKNNLTK